MLHITLIVTTVATELWLGLSSQLSHLVSDCAAVMDDLNGLFSASPVAPPVASPVGGQGLTMPGQQVMSPPVMPITPTQTMAAEQLNNKTQILNQFQVGGGVGGMVSPPGRPAPSLPGLVPAQPPTSPLLPPTSSQSLTLSSSFTEPGPVEFDDNFFGSPAPTVPEEPAAPDSVDGSSDFFIGDNETSPPTVVETTEETKAVEETKTEEPNKEAEQTERKTSFWSGLWSRNKDHGSKENILENEEDGELINFQLVSLQLCHSIKVNRNYKTPLRSLPGL